MKTHNKNVTLIISVLIVFVTSLATYIVTNVEIPFIKSQYKWIVVIIIGAINVLAGCFPLIHFFTLGGQNWIIKQFMQILFNAFFLERINYIKEHHLDKIDDVTYRITYYKFYRKESFFLRMHYYYRKIMKNKYGKQRQLDISLDCLLCKYRLGIENGKYDTHKTTKPYILYNEHDKLNGVASLIYKATEKIYLCIDNLNINDIIQRIIHNKKTLSLYDSKYNGCSIDDNVEGMKELLNSYNMLWTNEPSNCISKKDTNEVIKFMEKTHTGYNDIFDISGGTHSNHFLGFKVYNQNHEAIGVFIIDAKDPLHSDFENIVFENKPKKLSISSNEKWIRQVLETFSNLTSSSIFELNSDKENKNGKRIRD